MTTDAAAAESRARIHDYHDLPGDEFYRALILLGFALVLFLSWRFEIFHGVVGAARHHQWGRFIVSPAILWAAMGMLMLLLRTLLWFRYRTPPLATLADAPSLTVIIPAYNEGEMVARSIESVVRANYPHDRLEIFVVDDGSVDDTWQHIERIARRFPGLVTALRFERNRGKRAALEAGFRRGRGEVMVTIDSDSVIEPDTLLAMAGPFADPRIGAVAGKVSVFNRGEGLIPRMLKVRFALSFDFLRAVQSTYGTVYCCPGALAAYRTSVVRDVLEDWVGQRFLGRACTYGEDRAMTNAILGEGYDCVYQRAGIVHTIVPTTYRRLCKMFLRWDRSYVREEWRFLRRIVWRRPPLARTIALVEAFVTNLRYPVAWATLVLLTALVATHPDMLLRFCCALLLVSSFNMLYYLRGERHWDFVYGIGYAFFSVFALFWIFPYALCTARAQGWLTR
ncbi:MAG TPA: glycosyltransferase family 2 protein [Rhodanobacteraceae bacterium]|nr:glycosyltransferase family 2 protein [Rhodanobacteraceae bacterium]